MQKYTNQKGEVILYSGSPDLDVLEKISVETGDLWHSSFHQGYKNAFPEIVYQSPTFMFVNDFDDLEKCVSWRINPTMFAIREVVWKQLGGFDTDFENPNMQALEFGYRLLRFMGGIPLFINDLYKEKSSIEIKFNKEDIYLFYKKNFKTQHSFYVLYRKGLWNPLEWFAFLGVMKNKKRTHNQFILPRKLDALSEKPTVSYIIPTMLRQDFTAQLLKDLKNQSFLPNQVVIIDATPPEKRDFDLYKFEDMPFEVILKWQETKGSCRARNEALALCTGDYIVFGDDDIRIGTDFIENQIRFLKTYNADACNGLDIQADNAGQDLDDLNKKLKNISKDRLISGVAQSFSNANSCVKRAFVNQLVGNDINFDGGYGEDSDFGISLHKIGAMVLYNPYAVNLHLKPATGGYRFWGLQAKIKGKKRKKQPWELDTPVKNITPVPSPTIMYGIIKQFTPQQLIEYKHKHFFNYLFKGSKIGFLYRLFRLPYKNLQFKKSYFYAKKLYEKGVRHQ